MSSEHYFDRMEILENKLGEAKCLGNTELEIAILIEMGKLAASEGDLGGANMRFALALGVIRSSCVGLERLNEVLGERALIFGRMKCYRQAVELYKQAAAAAQEYAGPLEYAHWVSKKGVIYRLMGETGLARDAFREARELFEGLGEAGKSGVADQEGNLGLLAQDKGDNKSAEMAYRRAVGLAISTGSNDLIRTWATNLGNALSRRRRYHEAWTFYDRAMAAAIQVGDDSGIRAVAASWSVSYRNAHRHLQAAETLINAISKIRSPVQRSELLEVAMADLKVAGAWQKLTEIGFELADILGKYGADPARLRCCAALIENARERLARRPSRPQPTPGQPTILDVFIISNMAEYEKSGNVMRMRDVAHLICDVGLGLMSSTEEAWKPLLSKTHLRYRVVGEAMKALCDAGMPEESLELSQRIKSLGFCLPNIERMCDTGAHHERVVSYLASMQRLSQAVADLKGPATEDGLQRVDAVRAAGEMLLEAGEKLHDWNPILHARLGGVIPPRDLINALPTFDPVGIVDLFVTGEGTIVHILIREGNNVRVIPAFAPHFSAEQARDLLVAWANCNISHEISERQKQGLDVICRTLHDKLMCTLARNLIKREITQIVLIPDFFTRHLPLHLSDVCAQEIDIPIPGISTTDATCLIEAFPVEYAPCLQAVAVSMHQKRPRTVSAVLSLADPMSDLPGARNTAKWLASRLPKTLEYTSHVGEKATLKNLSCGIDRADVVVIGTHGSFNSASPEKSFLQFHDGRWTMSDMLDRPAYTMTPVIVLSACEVGAAAPTPDDLAATGIPGALISAGAACVLASLWPVEDISMGYVTERFLFHLSSRPGLRPAAALFRALRNLRQLTQQEALERCYNLLDEMERNGTLYRLRDHSDALREVIDWILDADLPHPFADRSYWGGTIIIGSGWHSPAGALVGPSHIMIDYIEDSHAKGEKARSLMAEGRFGQAKKVLEEILIYADGVDRARILDALAWAVWGSRRTGDAQAAKVEAMELLAQAEFVAKAEQDDQLLRNVYATRQKIGLNAE